MAGILADMVVVQEAGEIFAAHAVDSDG